MTEFRLKRIGLILELDPGNPKEAEGILSPAAVRGHTHKPWLIEPNSPFARTLGIAVELMFSL